MHQVERLALVRQERAQPGTLLIRRPGGEIQPLLTVAGDQRPSPWPLLLSIVSDPSVEMTISPASAGTLYLATDRWELRVDTETAYTGMQDMPRAGDAFLSSGIAGFNARRDHSEAYVSTAGELLPEPDWGGGYVAFRRWEIVYWPDGEGEPVTLIERNRPERDKGSPA